MFPINCLIGFRSDAVESRRFLRFAQARAARATLPVVGEAQRLLLELR